MRLSQQCEPCQKQHLHDFHLQHEVAPQNHELVLQFHANQTDRGTSHRKHSCSLITLVRYKYLKSPCLGEYVVREFAALSETQVFQLHQYFDPLNGLALIALNQFGPPRNLHVVRQIPLELRSAGRYQQQCQRPTPLVPSAMSKLVNRLQQLQMHFLNAHIR